jgi:hypothetical protein
MAYFVIERQAVHPDHDPDDWRLCLQWGRIEYGTPNEPPQWGYRFIWRRPDGTQQARGAARIRSRHDIERLWKIADDEGWGDFDGYDPPMPAKKVA